MSVAVDVFTLVCISIERYIAICRPLLILKLQSLRFANVFNGLILTFIWSLALLIASPNLFMYNLCSLPRSNKFKCEKVQPKYFDERIYMIGLLSKIMRIIFSFVQFFSFSFLSFDSNVNHDRSLHINYL